MNTNLPASVAGGGGTGASTGDVRRLHPEVPVCPPDPPLPPLPSSPPILIPSNFGVLADKFNKFESILNSNVCFDIDLADNIQNFQANTLSPQDAILVNANTYLGSQGQNISNFCPLWETTDNSVEDHVSVNMDSATGTNRTNVNSSFGSLSHICPTNDISAYSESDHGLMDIDSAKGFRKTI